MGYTRGKILEECRQAFHNNNTFYQCRCVNFWSGYRETKNMKYFLSECEKMGLKIVTLHTSGHADLNTLRRLIEQVHPQILIPVHTENAKRFREIVPDVALLTDEREIRELR